MPLKKDLYEIGEFPPLGHLPRQMYAATIRPERYGEPSRAFAIEVVDTPPMGPRQVMLHVMAAGINYNALWVCRGKPVDVIAIRQKRGEPEDFHIAGTECAAIVWAVGSEVKTVKPGDRVVTSAMRWDPRTADIVMGLDPVMSSSASVWGYEDNYGCFAQFSVVDEFQCYPKPPKLSFEEAACFLANGSTSYRQLMGWPPNVVRPGMPVLIWGGAGGLGSMAIQIARHFGGLPVAVVSDDAKRDFCMSLGAKGTINRRHFTHWGRMPEVADREGVEGWLRGVRSFGKQIWEAIGARLNPGIVFEHSGKDTLPTSIFVCDTSGMVVLCGATSGYHSDLDLRYMWMRMKRLQGSHFATPAQVREVNQLVHMGAIRPPLSRTYSFPDIAEPHQLMHENRHPPGNMSVLINAPGEGLEDIAL